MSLATLKESYTSSGCGCFLFFVGRRILFSGFWLFRAVIRAAAAALLHARRIQFAAHDGVAHADVLHTSAADEDDRVFLQGVPLAGDVRSNLHAIGEAYTCNLADCGVRFAGSLGRDACTDTALEGRRIERR